MTERLHVHFSLSRIGERNGNPLQCSCLENPRDSGAWWAAVYGVAQSRTRLKQLSSKVLLPRRLRCKEPACKAGDPSFIPGWGRSPGEGNGNPLQYSCMKNPTERGACGLQSMESQRVGDTTERPTPKVLLNILTLQIQKLWLRGKYPIPGYTTESDRTQIHF